MSNMYDARLRVIRILREELKQSVTFIDSQLIEGSLDALQQQYGESAIFVVKAFELFQKHPQTNQRLLELVQEIVDKQAIESDERFDPLPGVRGSIVSGAKMICPQDSCGYEDELLQDGEILYCPIHHKQLVLKNSTGE